MKKLAYIFTLAILLSAVFFAVPVSASIDDFDIEYEVSPTQVGYKGADINVRIRVTNEGTTPIRKIEVGVTTMDGYTQERVGTISPGTTTPWLLFVVPFDSDDLNIDKLLTVKIENDSDSAWDGTQVRTFRVQRVRPIFDVSVSQTPHFGYYMVGETVTLTYSFTNTFETHAAIDVLAHGHFNTADPVTEIIQTEDFAMVMPEGTVDVVQTHTFTEQDVGFCEIGYSIGFEMMDERYGEYATLTEIEVRSPIPDIDFTCSLSADKTEIEAGESVEFLAEFVNIGEDSLSFEVRNSEGGLVATTGTYPTGGDGYARIDTHIFETTDVSYVVIAYASGYSEAKETNPVRITVREPEESSTPTITEETTATPEPTTEVTTERSPTPSAEPSSEPVVSLVPDEPPSSSNVWLYIIIAALGAAVIGGGIIIILLLKKKKPDAQNKRNEEQL